MINITGIDLVAFAKKVYELSVPQGLGFLHFTPAPLSDEEAKELVSRYETDSYHALNMDYVNGRACKMTVYREGDQLFISNSWYDHSNHRFQKLLDALIDIKPEISTKHGTACNCVDCQGKGWR